ncbi:MAG: antA/AntB antirepressor family protein, partial [Desulfovibrionaceae bacterium]|nr:antA/AntB antirepressor family protein [Desulfovibrionaceae bacterium]
MTASQLVPVVPGTIGNVPCLTVDGRSLHGVLGVRRDFSNWIKGRISKYGFVDGQDFEVFAKTGENPNFDSPDLANQKKRGGDRRSQEYRLTVGMGKELCMVENNEHGRVARRYFIECERRLLSPQPTSEPSPISKRNDPERKALTAIINTWVSMAPVHYAAARAQVNAHFGVASVDALTVAQVKEAIQWVQAKIDALPPASAQPALPAVPEKDKFEAYIEKVEQF